MIGFHKIPAITSIVLSQIDLLHIHANTTEEGSSDHVEVGIDLTEYYINVEWDILRWTTPTLALVHKEACQCSGFPQRDMSRCTLAVQSPTQVQQLNINNHRCIL